MREIARGEARGAVPLPPFERDECIRAAFASAAPVRMALVDGSGKSLVTSSLLADGFLGPRGPVCFHPDAQPSLQAGGDAGSVRYVVWGAP
jgi:hypothetical protein